MIVDTNIKRPYSVENYNPEWVSKFNCLKETFREVFGSKALAIEHVGSTSFGIKAKPIIDVLIVVQNIGDVKEERLAMARLGYKSQDNCIAPRTIIFAKEESDGRKTENIHVCEVDSPKEKQFLIMRDYFRTHPERAKMYEELKEKLNKEFPNDYPAYREGKNSFLVETETLAYDWNAHK
ncbi:MAG: GrpB family protein [Minisyncoccia bacterium]